MAEVFLRIFQIIAAILNIFQIISMNIIPSRQAGVAVSFLIPAQLVAGSNIGQGMNVSVPVCCSC